MKSWIILLYIITNSFVSCSNKEIKINIKNKSKNSIKEMNVFVQNRKYRIHEIKESGYSIIVINKNEIALNAHDFRIESTAKFRDGKQSSGFYYSDLSGIPNSEYTIDVYDSISVIK